MSFCGFILFRCMPLLFVLVCGSRLAVAETGNAQPKPIAREATDSRAVAPGLSAAIAKYAPAPFEIKLPPVLAPAEDRVIHNGPRNRLRVALSFDACATRTPSAYDEGVIRVLVSERVPATLFLGGKWMIEHPDETRKLASMPQFELANHSFLHAHLVKASDERVRQELQWTQIVLYSLTGRQACVMRAPYGEIDRRVARLSAEMGLVPVQYDLASGDPDPRLTRAGLVKSVVRGARGGSIVVLHMNGRGLQTADALPEIIDALRQKGYEFATVSELIRGIP